MAYIATAAGALAVRTTTDGYRKLWADVDVSKEGRHLPHLSHTLRHGRARAYLTGHGSTHRSACKTSVVTIQP